MTSLLIDSYVAGLHRRLPPGIAEETAGGLIETYEHHLAAGAGEGEAAHAALAEFGDLATVVGEFTRQAPGRRAARLLLAIGLGSSPDPRPLLDLAGACRGAARLRRRPAPGGPGAAGRRDQPAQLPADQARRRRQPCHPRPGRDSRRHRPGRRPGPDRGAAHRRGGQPGADRVHHLDAAPPRRPLSRSRGG